MPSRFCSSSAPQSSTPVMPTVWLFDSALTCCWPFSLQLVCFIVVLVVFVVIKYIFVHSLLVVNWNFAFVVAFALLSSNSRNATYKCEDLYPRSQVCASDCKRGVLNFHALIVWFWLFLSCEVHGKKCLKVSTKLSLKQLREIVRIERWGHQSAQVSNSVNTYNLWKDPKLGFKWNFSRCRNINLSTNIRLL